MSRQLSLGGRSLGLVLLLALASVHAVAWVVAPLAGLAMSISFALSVVLGVFLDRRDQDPGRTLDDEWGARPRKSRGRSASLSPCSFAPRPQTPS